MYQALYGQAPSNALLTSYTAQATADASGFAAGLAGSFASTTSAALALRVLTNLGITATTVTAPGSYTTLLSAAQQAFDGYGVASRGQIILNVSNLLARLEGDVTYGVAAAGFNNQATANLAYGANTSNTSPATVPPAGTSTGTGTGTGGTGTGTGTGGTGTGGTGTGTTGSSFTLTTLADNFAGTSGNDSFNATYDAVATDTLTSADILAGGAGTDTLNISHIIDVAMTPPDTLWTGVSGIEKVVFTTSGNGAQTLNTGVNFDNAFRTGGVNLTASTTGSGAIDVGMGSFTGAATVVTTSLAGAQTIITGTGAATVTANTTAGAITIKGVGLVSAFATTTGGGAQTIGDAGGNGANLVTVNASSNSGAQVITSTSTSNVTVTASSTSGIQTITTGAGNDSITASSAAGTSNTITANAGNDVIIAGLGRDLITGGLGTDTMTGGGGVDTFAFGANGSVIGTSMDVITDFNASGADILIFGGSTAVLTADLTALAAGANVQTSTGGLATFHASDSTLALKIAAMQADVQLDAAGSLAMFVDGGNTYVYYAGTAAGNADDQLIQLTGINTLVTLTGGGTATIA